MTIFITCTKLSYLKFTDYEQLNPDAYSLYYISANIAKLMKVLKVAIIKTLYCSKIT